MTGQTETDRNVQKERVIEQPETDTPRFEKKNAGKIQEKWRKRFERESDKFRIDGNTCK